MISNSQALELAGTHTWAQKLYKGGDIRSILSAYPEDFEQAARQLASWLKNKLVFVEGEWLIHNGRFYEQLNKANRQFEYIVSEYTYLLITIMKEDLFPQAEEHRGKGEKGYAPRLINEQYDLAKSLGRARGASSLADKLQPLLSIPFKAFEDDDKRYIPFTDVLLDMHKIRCGYTIEESMMEHDPSLLLYRGMDYELGSRRSCSPVEDFLLYGANRDKETVHNLLASLGAALTAPSSTATVWDMFGVPGSGKSSFFSIIERCGGAYAAPGNERLLTGKNEESIQQGYASHKDTRWIFTSDSRSEINASTVLKYAGGDKMYARDLFKKAEPIAPQGMILSATNDGMKLDLVEDAIVRRWKPFYISRKPEQYNARFVDEVCLDKGAFIWLVLSHYEQWLRENPDRQGTSVQDFECTSVQLELQELRRGQAIPAIQYLHDLKASGVLEPSDDPSEWAEIRDLNVHFPAWQELRDVEGPKKINRFLSASEVKSTNGKRLLVGYRWSLGSNAEHRVKEMVQRHFQMSLSM